MCKLVLRICLGEIHGERCACSKEDQPQQLCHVFPKLRHAKDAAPWNPDNGQSSTEGGDQETTLFETHNFHEDDIQINRNIGLV
uniref:Uncharacterized protein n=1 Tax=Arundo donax TaxID=35708 RepID=A0A0A8Y0F6_ARUDO